MTCSNSELVRPLTSRYKLDDKWDVVCRAAVNPETAASLTVAGSGNALTMDENPFIKKAEAPAVGLLVYGTTDPLLRLGGPREGGPRRGGGALPRDLVGRADLRTG